MAKYFLTGGLAGPWKKSKVDNLATKPLECAATMSTDGGGTKTITLDKTAADLWAAAQAGKQIKIVMSNIPFGEQITGTVTVIVPFAIHQMVANEIESVAYTIVIRLDGDEDSLLIADSITADATVVLTEV